MTSLLGLALTDPNVPTPSFVIEEARLEKNLRRALDQARRLGVRLRPHLKTHKSIGIALRQMEAPQGPACVSTLLEAEYFFSHGVTDLLYAVGIAPQKLPQVAELRKCGCDLKIILDNAAAADAVSDYCRAHGVSIPVLLEVDVDGHRSGLAPESPELLTVAEHLRDGARLVGVLTHAGASYDEPDLEHVRLAAERERDGIVLAARRLRDAGHKIDIVSVGSTPTVLMAEDETGVTEVRCGVYSLFDLFMTNVGVATVDDIAGSVLATVIGHQPAKGQVIVDAGWMAMSRDRGTARQKRDYGYGLVCGVDGTPLRGGTVLMKGANQEHGIIEATEGPALRPEDFPVGTRLRILPNHACPTAAPYEKLLLVRDEKIIEELQHVRGW